MSMVYGIGGFVDVPPAHLSGSGAPPCNFKGLLGQQYFDRSQVTPVEYIYNGVAWEQGGNSSATTSAPGIVQLSSHVSTDY